MTVLVPLAQGCEELEAITVIDLLRRADIRVVTAGLDKEPVRASRQTVLIPDTDLDTALNEDYEMVVLPGGLPGANHLRDDVRIINLLQKMAAQDRYITAICAAPKVLVKAGVLTGKKTSCYPGSLNEMDLSGVTLSSEAVTLDGKVITSRGPGTAMDFALILIEKLAGKAKRNEVEAALKR